MDLSLDLIRGDVFRGVGDSVFFEAHVTVHISGVGELQIRTSTVVPAPRSNQQN